MLFAEILVACAMVYAACGLLFAVLFVTRGVNVVDPLAKESTAGFRLIIIPGAAALWPLLLKRWVQTS